MVLNKKAILFVLLCVLSLNCFAGRSNKQKHWDPYIVACAITLAEIKVNEEIYDKIAVTNNIKKLKPLLLKLAPTSNNLFEWTKYKLSRQAYRANDDFLVWLIDICNALIELGNFSSPTAILTGIAVTKKWSFQDSKSKEFLPLLKKRIGKRKHKQFVLLSRAFIPPYTKLRALEQKHNFAITLGNPAFWGSIIERHRFNTCDFYYIKGLFLVSKKFTDDLLDEKASNLAIYKYFNKVMSKS